MSLKISASTKSGHSSRPPEESSIGIISRSIDRIENYRFKPYYDGATKIFYDHISDHMVGVKRFLFKNPKFTRPILIYQLSKYPTSNASLRTTAIATQIQSSSESRNSLSESASAIINVRIHPNDNIDSVFSTVQELISDDRVRVDILEHASPSGLSTINSNAYENITSKLFLAYGNSIITLPYLVSGTTDSKHYSDLSDNTYRFSPILISSRDTGSIHGENEKLKIDSFQKAVVFYSTLFHDL